MKAATLEGIEADIDKLSLSEQLWLMERLAHRIRQHTLRSSPLLESELDVMAQDPHIQRELQQIEAEFAATDRGRPISGI